MIALETEKSILCLPIVGWAEKASTAAGFAAVATSTLHHTATIIPRQYRVKVVADSE